MDLIHESFSSLVKRMGRASLHLSWQAVRIPLLTLLVVLEPLITFVFMGIALLGVLMSVFYEYVVTPPDFPFWLMLGISLGFALCLLPYYGLIRLLSR